ncbi:hypothetical protein MBLNU459_g4092t1 [Dothideomycetes sp. NU459]
MAAPSSAVSRHPPWILAATGLAAAYCTYLVWSRLATTPATALQRRNAVHRPRRATSPRSTLQSESRRDLDSSTTRDPSAPFGVLDTEFYGETIGHTVGPDPPTPEQIHRDLNVDRSKAEDIAASIQQICLQNIFETLCNPDFDYLYGQAPLYRDLLGLVAPLRHRRIEELIPLTDTLCTGRWNYSSHAVAVAFVNHCRSAGSDTVDHNHHHALEVDVAETVAGLSDFSHSTSAEPGQGIKGLLYNIAEEQAKRQAYVHHFDLCSNCEAQNVHPRTHVFTKIKIPISTLAQPHQMNDLWYPGDPQKYWPLLKAPLRKRLATESGFDEVQIDAYYDQFSCIANVPFPSDGLDINAAIDRRAFHKAMSSANWPHPLEPSFLFDRLFSFYDINSDDVIDFEEFIQGLSYLRHSAKRRSMQRTFRGYDVDGDGLVSRRDFIRMLSARYAVQKHIVKDIIDAEEAELVRHTVDVVRSSQPISSAFATEDIPPGERRIPQLKSPDEFGESQIRAGGPVLPDGEELPGDAFVSAVVSRYGASGLGNVAVGGRITIADALEMRDRHRRSENVPIGGPNSQDCDRFLVETDSRDTRGQPNLDPPETRWRQDLEDAQKHNTESEKTANDVRRADESENFTLPDYILERGRAYEVPAAEKDFGKEILFQVVQEGINELLDPLFEAKEELADAVRETHEERRRLRKKIDDFVKRRETFGKELGTGAELDPLLATANSAYTYNTDHEGAAMTNHRNLPDTAPTGRAEVMNHILNDGAAAPSQGEIADVISSQIRQEAVSLDNEGLERMESSIRSLPLDDLLESAGYSIASPESERPTVSVSQEELSGSSIGEADDPTLPQNRPTVAPITTATGSDAEPMHLSPSSPPTPLPQSVEPVDVKAEDSVPTEDSDHPSDSRLEYLARLDVEAKSILERGGPGRLTLAELEDAVRRNVRDGRDEILALVEGWLEWAGF